MNRRQNLLLALLLATTAAACSPPPEPQFDLAALQRDIQQKTERMYWIHLRLDTAANEIALAEAAARELLEETGYRPERVEAIGVVHPDGERGAHGVAGLEAGRRLGRDLGGS